MSIRKMLPILFGMVLLLQGCAMDTIPPWIAAVFKILYPVAIFIMPLYLAAVFNRRRVAFFSPFLCSFVICFGFIIIRSMLDASSWGTPPGGRPAPIATTIVSTRYALLLSLVYCGWWAGVAATARYFHRREDK